MQRYLFSSSICLVQSTKASRETITCEWAESSSVHPDMDDHTGYANFLFLSTIQAVS